MTRAAVAICVAAVAAACGGPHEGPTQPPPRPPVGAVTPVPTTTPTPTPAPAPPSARAADGTADAGVPAAADDGGVQPVGLEDDGATTPDRHCVLLALRDPSEQAALEVEQQLAREGLRVAREGPDVALSLTAAEIRRLFGARLRWSVTGASATPTLIREVHLQGGRVPARLRSRVASFAIGHQICE